MQMIGLSPCLRMAGMTLAAAMVSTVAAAQECAYLGATENFNEIAYCVSSVLPSSRVASYGPEHLFDVSSATAWCEGARGPGIGETLSLRIDGGGPFRRILIEGGYQKSRTSFARNARPRTLEIRTDTGLRFEHVLEDTDGERMIYLPEPGDYGVIQLRVLDVYPGSQYEDLCISTILVDFDYEKFLAFEERAVTPEHREKDKQKTPDQAGTKPLPTIEDPPDLPEL